MLRICSAVFPRVCVFARNFAIRDSSLRDQTFYETMRFMFATVKTIDHTCFEFQF